MMSLNSCSSSSSFRSSARYSLSSVTSIQTNTTSPPPDPNFMPFLDQRAMVLFGSQDQDSKSFMNQGETFGGCQGDRKSHMGGYHGDPHGVIWVDDRYYTSVDVSRFEPQDIVVLAFNNSIIIHAEKVGADGCVTDRFSHKSLLPEDMDPLSVSGTLTADGMIVISVKSTSRPHHLPDL